MCGILAFTSTLDLDISKLQEAVAARGPDHYGSVQKAGITFESSVLSLRTPFTPQPVHKDNTVLCYNGQIYNILGHDTVYVEQLCSQNKFADLLRSEGEFAFVYYDGEDSITFGRDVLGRRSLVYQIHEHGELLIASTGMGNQGFLECDGGGKLYRYSISTQTVSEMQCLNYDFIVSRSIDSGVSPSPYLLESLKSAVKARINFPGTGVAVLFSGGLDCTIIAALLDDLLPADHCIELLNVAFENKRTGSMWDTPDRLLAHRSLQELQNRSKTGGSRLRLVEINIPYVTTLNHRNNVQELMSPTATVMDLSIAIAFYFASQPQPGCENPRVMFSGLGADELFAGYSRHTGAANDHEKLASELELDFLRLPHRNLGRDDRVCASSSREVRYPFLDSSVTELARTLPLNYKTDGETTKIILRQVAEQLRLTQVVNEKKRAIQFGARSAKMDPGSGNSKGHHTLR